MSKNNQGMEPQLKQESLEQAIAIKKTLDNLEGKDLGSSLVFNNGSLLSRFDDEVSPYLLGEGAEPITVFHYRNLSTVDQPGNAEFHDLMHFGTLRAAHSRAFSKRLEQNGLQFSEELLLTKVFNQSVDVPIELNSEFGDEMIIAAKIQAKSPFFIPDIGQQQYFKNRAVLYACGLFEVAEVDNDLFDEEGFPKEDIDQKVIQRLRDRGHDSIGYLNDIEDPGSLSLIILDKQQAESVNIDKIDFPGFRYKFGPADSSSIVEADKEKNIQIVNPFQAPFS
jgi:hypothetical protein